MTGLGVLHRQDEGYNLRSPSILALPGRDNHSKSNWSRPRKPWRSRTLTTRRSTVGCWPSRSSVRPSQTLTWLDLVDHGESADRVLAVVGSRALGIDRAAAALQLAAGDKPVECQVTTSEELIGLQRVTPDRHYVIDLTERDLDPGQYKLLPDASGRHQPPV